MQSICVHMFECLYEHLDVFKVILRVWGALLCFMLFILQQLHTAAALTVSAFIRLIS